MTKVQLNDVYWRKYGLPATALAAEYWWRNPGSPPETGIGFYMKATAPVRAIVERLGWPLPWRRTV